MLAPGMPGMSNVGIPPPPDSVTSISISLSSSSPSRNFLAERLAGAFRGVLADQRVEHAFLRGELGPRRHLLAALLALHVDGEFHEVAHDLLDVTADVADLGELGRLDLDERRVREAREAP